MCSPNLSVSLALVFVMAKYSYFLSQDTLTKRQTYFEIDCNGVFDKSIFFRLDKICEDCFLLFRERALHNLCKQNCFSTDYFSGCVEALLLDEEMKDFQKMRDLLGRK